MTNNSIEKKLDINLIAFKVALFASIGTTVAQLLVNIIFMVIHAAA